MKNRFLYGSLLCLIASISWGAMFPVAHHSFQYIEPFYFTIFRYIPVALILVIMLWVKEGKQAFKTEGKGWSLWFFGTMAFTVYNLFIFWGQHSLGDSGVLLASIMEALMPLISVLILWMLRGARPSITTIICILIAFVGVLLVITKGDMTTFASIGKQVVPLIALLASVIGWVIYTLGGSGFSNWSVLRYSALTCLYGTATSTAIVLFGTAFDFVDPPNLTAIKAVKWDLAFMIIFPGIIALLGWNVGVSIIQPVNGLLFINFVPITTVLITFIQGYALSIFEISGILLVVAGLLLNNIFQRRRLDKQVHKKAIDSQLQSA
ncbi:DMT family transporter [Bacillus sp. FJAT-50079]|uniref:DMT family transporter n=1 Tax=Bacillus sp. FJAT-50079 TaxID=2833577 RepID=UPI001BC9BD77|nr:DMT family transporter [Bacillus sp. FJAT-50079]MBS4206503.1 DMT family transporter [Bacillus sp. FJAT-50079]